MDNPEKLATYGTKDEDKQKQTHNTECIGLHHAQTNTRRVWRYQRGNQNPYNRQHNGQKKKVRKDNQRSTKHTHKTKDRITLTPLKTGSELRCSERVFSPCSTCGIRRVNLVTNSMINHEWGKDREVFMTSGTYPRSYVTQIFHSGQPSHGGDRKTFEVLTLT